MSNEVTKVVSLCNELGLHARAASNFVKVATQYSSDVTVVKDKSEVNGKSIIALIMLSVPCHESIIIKAKGEDASECVMALDTLINNKFGEPK